MTRSWTSADYRALAELRHQIRRFIRFSEDAARTAGLVPQQHQLLLALKGLPEGAEPTVGRLAERLQVRQHSVVELVDRLARHGLVERRRGRHDKRKVFVDLTPAGEAVLRKLSIEHRRELRAAGPALLKALKGLLPEKDGAGA